MQKYQCADKHINTDILPGFVSGRCERYCNTPVCAKLKIKGGGGVKLLSVTIYYKRFKIYYNQLSVDTSLGNCHWNSC